MPARTTAYMSSMKGTLRQALQPRPAQPFRPGRQYRVFRLPRPQKGGGLWINFDVRRSQLFA